MAINIGDIFRVDTQSPLDGRFANITSIEEMKNIPETSLYPGAFCCIVGDTDKKTYQWWPTNEVDPELGKWRESSLNQAYTADEATITKSNANEFKVKNKGIGSNQLEDTIRIKIENAQEQIQFMTMPLPTLERLNDCVQFVGETTTTAPIYKNCYWYKCCEILPQTDPRTFEWVEKSSGGTIQDVRVNNVSVVSNNIANIDLEGKQDKIDEEHKLSADLLSDGTTNKTVTQTEKNSWNAKSVVSVSDSGTSTTLLPKYLTVNGDEYKVEMGSSFKFKGYISTTDPTLDTSITVNSGDKWYESSTLPTTFPINVKTYGTSSWSETTEEYTPVALDLWSLLATKKGYYWFGGEWNNIDTPTSEVDNLTINLNASNQIQVKDGGVTFAKLNTNVLPNFVNVVDTLGENPTASQYGRYYVARQEDEELGMKAGVLYYADGEDTGEGEWEYWWTQAKVKLSGGGATSPMNYITMPTTTNSYLRNVTVNYMLSVNNTDNELFFNKNASTQHPVIEAQYKEVAMMPYLIAGSYYFDRVYRFLGESGTYTYNSKNYTDVNGNAKTLATKWTGRSGTYYYGYFYKVKRNGATVSSPLYYQIYYQEESEVDYLPALWDEEGPATTTEGDILAGHTVIMKSTGIRYLANVGTSKTWDSFYCEKEYTDTPTDDGEMCFNPADNKYYIGVDDGEEVTWQEYDGDIITPRPSVETAEDGTLYVDTWGDRTIYYVNQEEFARWEKVSSKVSVSNTGTATDTVGYITVDGVEKKIGGASSVATLTDVLLTDLQNNQTLKWDSTQNKWVNASGSSGGSNEIVGTLKIFAHGIMDTGYVKATGSLVNKAGLYNTLWTSVGYTFSNAWESNIIYPIEAVVKHDNKLYVCIESHTSGEDFDPTKWEENTTQFQLPYVVSTDEFDYGIRYAYSTPSGEAVLIDDVGTIKIYTGDSVPNGTLDCDGTFVLKATYTELFNKVGYKFTPAFKVDTEYNVNDYVVYGGNLYKCITEHTATEWVAANWEQDTTHFQLPLGDGKYIVGASTLHAVGEYLSPELPLGSFGATFTGTAGATNETGNHSHSTSFPECYTGQSGSGQGKLLRDYYYVQNATWWSSTTGNHSHTFTPSGSVAVTQNEDGTYKATATVQPSSLVAKYCIVYTKTLGTTTMPDNETLHIDDDGNMAVMYQTMFDMSHPINSHWVQYGTDDDPNVLFDVTGKYTSTWEEVTTLDGRYFKVDSTNPAGTLEDAGLPVPTLADHTHTRGTMNITGSVGCFPDNACFFNGMGHPTGAFYQTATNAKPNLQQTGSNINTWAFMYDASRSWSGETSGSHSTITEDDIYKSGNTTVKPSTYTIKLWKRTA